MELIVFVHLGRNPAPTLNLFAKVAKECYSGASVVLLTDDKRQHRKFPGEIIQVETKELFSNLKSEDKKLHKRMGGYWLHTLNRLFVLRNLEGHFPKNTKVIHLESDVLSLISDSMGTAIWEVFRGVGVPRFSKDSGIASILIASDIEKLVDALNSLEYIAKNSKEELDDMHLLGIGLNNKILKDLNLESIKSLDPGLDGQPAIYFDGLAAGQYLFGCNMVHSDGFIKSGYVQKNSPIHFTDVEWSEPKWRNCAELLLDFKYEDLEYRIANLHIHSKLKIDTSLDNKSFWEDTLEKANLGKVTVYRKPPFLYKYKELTIRFLLKLKSKIYG